MRAIRLAVAFSLTAGVALAAGSASAQRIDGDFALADDVAPAGTNTATIEIDGKVFGVDGQVNGIGTQGDQCAIVYNTDEPTSASANNKNGKVAQSSFTDIGFVILPVTSPRALNTGLVSTEKCKVSSSVDPAAGKGKVSVNCKGANVFANFTADQVNSFIAAFQTRKDVKIKVNQTGSEGSVAIKLNQK